MNFIISDISGTNTRFAYVENNIIRKIRDYKTKDIKNFNQALQMYCYLEKIEEENILLSAAGKIDNSKVNLSNSNLEINKEEIEKVGFKKVYLINDFEAIAYGVNDVKKFYEITPQISSGDYLTLGAGTGFGVSIFRNNVSVNEELGHTKIDLMNSSTWSLKEKDFINWMGEKIETENILSGRGLERIYEYIAGAKLSAEEISLLETKSSFETFELFYSFYIKVIIYFLDKFNLNQVYIAGGIIMKNMKYLTKEIENNWKEKLNQKGCTILLDYDVSLFGLKNLGLKIFGSK